MSEEIDYKSAYESVLILKDMLIKENQQLKENKNFCEMINDKEWVDYKFEYENNQRVMKDLFKQLEQYKSVLDEIREYIGSKNNGICIINGEEKGAYTFLLDFDKAREFVWDLLQILDKVQL